MLNLSEEVNKRVEWTKDKFNSLGLPPFDIKVSVVSFQKKGLAGRATGNRLVEISKDFLLSHFEETIRETVPHEVAHCYVSKYFPSESRYKGGHGAQWKRLMEALGLSQSRYHRMGNSNEVKIVSTSPKVLQVSGFVEIKWNPALETYEAFSKNLLLGTHERYRILKEMIEKQYGPTLFNVTLRS